MAIDNCERLELTSQSPAVLRTPRPEKRWRWRSSPYAQVIVYLPQPFRPVPFLASGRAAVSGVLGAMFGAHYAKTDDQDMKAMDTVSQDLTERFQTCTDWARTPLSEAHE